MVVWVSSGLEVSWWRKLRPFNFKAPTRSPWFRQRTSRSLESSTATPPLAPRVPVGSPVVRQRSLAQVLVRVQWGLAEEEEEEEHSGTLAELVALGQVALRAVGPPTGMRPKRHSKEGLAAEALPGT